MNLWYTLSHMRQVIYLWYVSLHPEKQLAIFTEETKDFRMYYQSLIT